MLISFYADAVRLNVVGKGLAEVHKVLRRWRTAMGNKTCHCQRNSQLNTFLRHIFGWDGLVLVAYSKLLMPELFTVIFGHLFGGLLEIYSNFCLLLNYLQ